jgi:hypothetical protein
MADFPWWRSRRSEVPLSGEDDAGGPGGRLDQRSRRPEVEQGCWWSPRSADRRWRWPRRRSGQPKVEQRWASTDEEDGAGVRNGSERSGGRGSRWWRVEQRWVS